MDKLSLFLFIGYLLDLIFGDPYKMPHPVRGVGFLVKKLEPLFYRNPYYLFGGLFNLVIIFISYVLVYFSFKYLSLLNLHLGYFLTLFLIYSFLAVKSLEVESLKVYTALKTKNLPLARIHLGQIVSRETKHLQQKDIIRATVETIAENTVDGVISPMFYLTIGGPILGMLYKTINTLDSMVGYKTPRYNEFGFFSAKLDDIINFLPARVGVIFLLLSSLILKLSPRKVWHSIIKYGHKHPSLNAGIPEAGFAGALGVKLGGTSVYEGKEVKKPVIGEERNKLTLNSILIALRMMKLTSFFTLITFITVRQLLFVLWNNLGGR